MWCWELSLVWLHAKQAPYFMYYSSGTPSNIFRPCIIVPISALVVDKLMGHRILELVIFVLFNKRHWVFFFFEYCCSEFQSLFLIYSSNKDFLKLYCYLLSSRLFCVFYILHWLKSQILGCGRFDSGTLTVVNFVSCCKIILYGHRKNRAVKEKQKKKGGSDYRSVCVEGSVGRVGPLFLKGAREASLIESNIYRWEKVN